MKILFSVLLITTFAIASSVAIQEVLQAEVDAPALDSPGPATVGEGALWNKKKHHHHHHHRKCRNNIDQFFDHDCKDTCTKQTGDCKGKCELQKGGCKDKCTDSDSRCNLLCDDNSVGLCIQTVGGLLGTTTEAIKRDCREVFSCKDKCNDKFEDSQQRDKNCEKVCGSDDCTETCISLRDSGGLKSDDPTACEKVCDKCFDKCTDKFKSTVPTPLLNTFCKSGCDIKEQCRLACKEANKPCGDACETCDKECDTACLEREGACTEACDSGKRRCKHCDADTDDDTDADATALEEDPTIAAVSA